MEPNGHSAANNNTTIPFNGAQKPNNENQNEKAENQVTEEKRIDGLDGADEEKPIKKKKNAFQRLTRLFRPIRTFMSK